MFEDPTTRRAFIRSAGAAGATWLLAEASQVEAALAWAAQRRAAPGDLAFESLSAVQASDLEAVTMRIFPSDDTPGAREAGVIHFIDRALATFNASQKPLMMEGLAALNRRATQRWPGTTSFAGLPAERQDELLREIEAEPFFQAVRFAAIVGMFAQPSWGGNRDHAGWTLIGQEHRPLFQPPFGFYDDEANGRRQ